MNKKIFGIRIGTILSVGLCLLTAVVFWLFVKYSGSAALSFAAPMLFGV